jgi:ribosome-associated protein
MRETAAAARRDLQKLQRTIVDGLEQVKAFDISVFDTTELSPLFERVMIASGTSNRQTRAIAASVRDKVSAAGFPKPLLEGEEAGEWIIIDCGAAVAHVMQPAIRQYYRLEELWGDKPVRVKLGTAKTTVASPKKSAARSKGELESSPAAKKVTVKTAAVKKDAAPAKKPVAKKVSAPRKSAVTTATAASKKRVAKKAPASKKTRS